MEKKETAAVAYVILGIVAIMAIVGLVLLFRGGMATGQFAERKIVSSDFMVQDGGNVREGTPPVRYAYDDTVTQARINSADASNQVVGTTRAG